MANNNQNIPANLNNHCSFKFTFEFYGSIPSLGFYQNLEKNIKSNLQKAIGNNFFTKYFFPKSRTIKIASNVYDVLGVTRDYNNDKIIFEYSEFSDQQELYPDTDQIATSFAVILKSCLDLINQYASNRASRNIMVDLDFFFTSNVYTYYSSSSNIWGIQVIPNMTGIPSNGYFCEKLHSQTIPIDVLRKFVQTYICVPVNGWHSVDIDLSIAQTTWDNVFKKLNVWRRGVEFIRYLFIG